MKLAIISHTEHYTTEDGTVVGWSPTVNEINHLLELFDTIYHLAMHHKGPAPQSTMAYASERIQFIALPTVGGKGIKDKLGVLMQATKVIGMVSKTLKQVDYFQLRTPTGIGVYLIPYLTWFSKTKGWYKYAGNWNQKHPPLGYRLQRFMLKQQSRKVTINGHWEDQPEHCLSFENPCLTEADLHEGMRVRKEKTLEGPLTLCFVGRIEAEKGVGRILKALTLLTEEEIKRIAVVHFVGEGTALKKFKKQAKNVSLPIIFHGALSRVQVFEIYKVSHVIVMPTTASEGFPKVLAEAMAFGCIPIVSNISSISHYIKNLENGFLIQPVTIEQLVIQIQNMLMFTNNEYQQFLAEQQQLSKLFTFIHYNQRIKNNILKSIVF